MSVDKLLDKHLEVPSMAAAIFTCTWRMRNAAEDMFNYQLTQFIKLVPVIDGVGFDLPFSPTLATSQNLGFCMLFKFGS